MQEGYYKKLIITHISQETKDVKQFFFGESNISFKAGQYLTFAFDEHGKEARRSYSIASSPILDEPLSIAIRRIVNGNFSRKMFDYRRVGDELLTLGAGGVFTLPEDLPEYKQIFFFAAGSGIIPIYSLIKTVLYSTNITRVILVYSNSTPSNTLFYQSLKDLMAKFQGRFQLELLFSNSVDLAKAHLHSSLIAMYLNLHNSHQLESSLYYVCGPQSYMRMCIFTLHGMHIPVANIKKEIFYTSKPIHKREPPDKASHEVVIILNQEKYKIDVRYPTTILQAAKNEGIVLPYSCEVGRCGNCMATCLKGTIWMSYNEVLTEKELSRGLILTCTGFPVNLDAVISFDHLHE
jgi:ring-1,2-phenylacetyl-CoA epoxidase subunit PaaE